MEQKQKATFKQFTVRFASLEHELTKDPMAARILHQDHGPQNGTDVVVLSTNQKAGKKIYRLPIFVAHHNNIRSVGYSVGHDQD